MALRLAGVGYSTGFFLESINNGRKQLIENSKFSWRFFPPRLARTPQPISLEMPKPAGTTRIFVFGESAAMGDPEPAFGFARQLEVMLQARHPEKRIEVVNVAMTAINSHVIREIAADCAGLGGDCWIVYAGNNEVIGPYGAGTVFGRQAPPLAFVRLSLWLKRSRVVQCLGRLVKPAGLPVRWEGMELFLDQQVTLADPRLPRVYDNFNGNLKAIVDAGVGSRAKVILSTVAVNLKDSPPFGSRHRPTLSLQQGQQWDRDFAAGRDAEQQGRTPEALKAYERAAQIDPDYAELPFRLAWRELAQGDAATAKKGFLQARELDTLRFRADSRLNETIRRTGRAGGLRVLDAEQELGAAAATSGVPGEDLFYDHVHLNFHGSYLLACLLVTEVERRLFGESSAGTPDVASEEEVARRLAFTDLERRRVFAEMRARLQQPPFSTQSNFKERDERWRRTVQDLKVEPSKCLPRYAEALATRTNDWVLHANFARALEVAGDAAKATAEWQQVVRIIPHFPEAWFQLGNLALNSRNFGEAQRFFREALQRNPASPDTLNSLGLAASGIGQKAEAQRWFKAALEVDPLSTAARINLAAMLGSAGETAAAAAEYKSILTQETNNIAARINYARLLTSEGKRPEAIALLEQAVTLKPDEPLAHYELANALAAQQQYTQALAHYQAAVNARPDFFEARYNLAMELARAGSIDAALPHFAEAVRLRPESADGHFSYGIALARQKSYPKAIAQFQETLRINPQHAKAQAALQRAQSLQNEGAAAPR